MGKIKKWDLWDYLLWGSIIAIIIWSVLKSLEIINTPSWVLMIPYFAGALALIGFVFKAGKISRSIECMSEDVKDLKTKTEKIDGSLIALSERVALREETIRKIDDKVDTFTNPKK